MNFEELIETRDARKTVKVRLPYGYFYKRQIEGKYSNFVEFHDEVADNIYFQKCVKAEYDALSGIEGGVYQGNPERVDVDHQLSEPA